MLKVTMDTAAGNAKCLWFSTVLTESALMPIQSICPWLDAEAQCFAIKHNVHFLYFQLLPFTTVIGQKSINYKNIP